MCTVVSEYRTADGGVSRFVRYGQLLQHEKENVSGWRILHVRVTGLCITGKWFYRETNRNEIHITRTATE